MTDTYPLACKHGRMIATTTDKRARGLTQACSAECPPADPTPDLAAAVHARLDELERSTRAKHMHAMNQAMRAVLNELCTGPGCNCEVNDCERLLRVIADAIGLPDEG